MSQDFDAGALLLFILIGYVYWLFYRSLGEPPAGSEQSEADRAALEAGLARHWGGLLRVDPDAREPKPPDPLPPAVAAALTAIRARDRRFRTDGFLAGAAAAYRAVVEAFDEGDICVLAGLASAEVCDGFAAEIGARDGRSGRDSRTLSDLRSAEIVDATICGASAAITVRFAARFCVRRDGDDAFGEGDPADLIDEWTFVRALGSADPNWTVAATRPG